MHSKRGKFEKCEYCNAMLLKQEDSESNLLPWFLYPSLSLLIYLAEDLDIKKKPRSFYLDVTEETSL